MWYNKTKYYSDYVESGGQEFVSKKPKKRKQLSAYEIERRHKLREQRKVQLKKEKRLFWIKAVIIAVSFVSFFIGIFLIDWHFNGDGLIIYLAIVLIVAATFTDRCGIRRMIFYFYPEDFIFGDYLKKSYPQRSFLMELCRTICYYSLALLSLCPKLSAVWAVICVITIAIGYAYVVFDKNDEYTLDKFSKYSDTTTFLILVCIPGCAMLESLEAVHLFETFFGGVILTVLYLLFGCSKNKARNATLIFFCSQMSISSLIAIIKVLV